MPENARMWLRHPDRASPHPIFRSSGEEAEAMRGVMAKGEPALRVTSRPMGESLLIRVQGKLTAATVSTFDSAIAAALRSDAHALVIDLCEVTDIDARGVGELVRAHTLGQTHNRSVRFLIRNGRIAHLIRLANLDEALTLLEAASGPTPHHAARESHSPL